jgi:hypothetical protein
MATIASYELLPSRQSFHLAQRLAVGRGEQVDDRLVLRMGHISAAPNLGEYHIDFVRPRAARARRWLCG